MLITSIIKVYFHKSTVSSLVFILKPYQYHQQSSFAHLAQAFIDETVASAAHQWLTGFMTDCQKTAPGALWATETAKSNRDTYHYNLKSVGDNDAARSSPKVNAEGCVPPEEMRDGVWRGIKIGSHWRGLTRLSISSRRPITYIWITP